MVDEPKPVDPIDQAIADTSPTDLQGIPVTIGSTGLQMVVAVPRALTMQETLELVSWISRGGINAWLMQQDDPASKLVTARGLPAHLD